MIIALAIPAYRQAVHIRTAYEWAQNTATALELGWKPALIWVDNSGIPRARNQIVEEALKLDARLLLMCDSDTFSMQPEGGLASMWQVMCEHDAAAVGAAVVTRNGTGVNCEPSRPGESYEGEVGTGLFLIDLWKLRDLPKPWFVHRDSDDGLRIVCGEDIYFCRHARAHGHKVIINYRLPTGHADHSISQTFE